MAGVRFGIERLGFGFRRARHSLWFHGANVESFGAAAPLFRDVLGHRRDVALVATSSDRAVLGALRRRFPDDIVRAAPCAAAGSVRRFLARVHPCALVLLEDGQALDEATLARLRESLLPVRALPDVEATEGRAALRKVLPSGPVGASVGPSWQVPTLRDRVGRSRAWAAVAPALMRRRIDDWQRLRERLSGPQTVLCLGNGPSSEDPRLASLEHDCLIRVNWRWRERRFLLQPDLVFVGDAATMYKAPPCIFAFGSVQHEHAMLLRRLVTRGPGAMEYITLERLSPEFAEDRWPARPSNGALAIVAAAALAPERLIIGGMDLYGHPGGRYPWAPEARNEYSAAHRIETELAIIDLALRDFRGELVILSEVLREHLDRHRERARTRDRDTEATTSLP